MSIEVQTINPGEYQVTQHDTASLLPAPTDTRKQFAWYHTAIGVEGIVDTVTKKITTVFSLRGIALGTFEGTFGGGILIRLEMISEKGTVKLSVKNGLELWVKTELKAFIGRIDEEAKVISWGEKIECAGKDDSED
ncbi:hypothetical protein TWF694_003125 [Orbilia ellipsospora]|uniref:Uncharacterized protein n=1 Tax=Orbilia ellipsospora TaxID=2528407 RepID=A0AAV9X1V2_9PEZI